jgi:hypothetical protein
VDHTEPPEPIDGAYRYVLVVRDLGSGSVLLAEPCQRKDAATAARLLEALFEEHGAPLVLKGDRGFVAAVLEKLARRWSVLWLHSPAHWPGYNGACESSIDWLKVHADYQALRAGHAGLWTRADLERARDWMNQGRRKYHGLRAEEAFAARREISLVERRSFAITHDWLQLEIRRMRGCALDALLPPKEEQLVQRHALEATLLKHGFLKAKRGRLSLPISSISSAIFS